MAGSFGKSLESHRHLLGDVDAQRVALDKSVALAEVLGTIGAQHRPPPGKSDRARPVPDRLA